MSPDRGAAGATVFEVRDELWEAVEPMIPPVRQPEKRVNAIVFVLAMGIAWAHVPRELGCPGL
jgi:transposase